MAGETSKTTALTSVQAGNKRSARLALARERVAIDTHAFTTGQLEAADALITAIEIPSNAVVTEIAVYNDDLDSNGTPTLTLDVGLAAAADFTSTTGGTDTKHNEDDVLDADAFVDGSTVLQAATSKYEPQDFDSATFGPDDAAKACWEVLGYDEDPGVNLRVVLTCATAAATAAAGDVAVRVKYNVD